MGVIKQLDKYEQNVLSSLNLNYRGSIWCELGSQIYHRDKTKSAKSVYVKRGVDHTSIDINGKFGALVLDLDFPVPVELLDKFDVVTNYGTIEHVNNQYQVFKNMHDMCRVRGIMIHGFPEKNTWEDHCRYYYNEDFIKQLASLCGYSIYNLSTMDLSSQNKRKILIVVTFMKEYGDFITSEVFNTLSIYDSKDMNNTGNYTKGRR